MTTDRLAELLCWLGIHSWQWPPHKSPWSLWEDYRVECARGCGARAVMRCYTDTHWSDRHPEPTR